VGSVNREIMVQAGLDIAWDASSKITKSKSIRGTAQVMFAFLNTFMLLI
jgi:hypothetical protein